MIDHEKLAVLMKAPNRQNPDATIRTAPRRQGMLLVMELIQMRAMENSR